MPHLTTGGEGGIRTHGTAFSGTLDFESSAFVQLSHLSIAINYTTKMGPKLTYKKIDYFIYNIIYKFIDNSIII
jgi:3-deoxy-D-arabino-heptulosonate 7-phosphate (DAHP) synthase